MAWTTEMKQAAKERYAARMSKGLAPEAVEEAPEAEQEKPIAEYAQEQENVIEDVVLSHVEPAEEKLLDVKPDLSKLDDSDKMQSLLNLLKVLPEQYRQNREMLKENVYNLARFTPTDEMLDIVLDGSFVPPQRFPN
jgi:hypothetical protein